MPRPSRSQSSRKVPAACCTLCCISATRTQVYLTAEQRARIDLVVRRDAVTLAEVVRRALDQYLADVQVDPQAALDATYGADPGWPALDPEAWAGG